MRTAYATKTIVILLNALTLLTGLVWLDAVNLTRLKIYPFEYPDADSEAAFFNDGGDGWGDRQREEDEGGGLYTLWIYAIVVTILVLWLVRAVFHIEEHIDKDERPVLECFWSCFDSLCITTPDDVRSENPEEKHPPHLRPAHDSVNDGAGWMRNSTTLTEYDEDGEDVTDRIAEVGESTHSSSDSEPADKRPLREGIKSVLEYISDALSFVACVAWNKAVRASFPGDSLLYPWLYCCLSAVLTILAIRFAVLFPAWYQHRKDEERIPLLASPIMRAQILRHEAFLEYFYQFLFPGCSWIMSFSYRDAVESLLVDSVPMDNLYTAIFVAVYAFVLTLAVGTILWIGHRRARLEGMSDHFAEAEPETPEMHKYKLHRKVWIYTKQTFRLALIYTVAFSYHLVAELFMTALNPAEQDGSEVVHKYAWENPTLRASFIYCILVTIGGIWLSLLLDRIVETKRVEIRTSSLHLSTSHHITAAVPHSQPIPAATTQEPGSQALSAAYVVGSPAGIFSAEKFRAASSAAVNTGDDSASTAVAEAETGPASEPPPPSFFAALARPSTAALPTESTVGTAGNTNRPPLSWTSQQIETISKSLDLSRIADLLSKNEITRKEALYLEFLRWEWWSSYANMMGKALGLLAGMAWYTTLYAAFDFDMQQQWLYSLAMAVITTPLLVFTAAKYPHLLIATDVTGKESASIHLNFGGSAPSIQN
eukprot:TRINITY_DN5865_c0_g1_i1.p1 TRINITY_DN5865_c0_g1~~TRINITY_DN5865_c0_g1_i1.p1  ORF type:complete len:710 (+),score=181.54 TRINITY_DN5865_c0_g1_i1:117-2246(+)